MRGRCLDLVAFPYDHLGMKAADANLTIFVASYLIGLVTSALINV
jgi:hypothetical protein